MIYSEDFEAALLVTLINEGGWSDDPDDRGGQTNQGVTQLTYDLYRDRTRQGRQTVRSITRAEILNLYYTMYWLPAGCQHLPAELAADVFDAAVHSGPTQAVKWLQKTVGAKADGMFGADTLLAVNRFLATDGWRNLDAAYNKIRAEFLEHFAKRPGQGKWLKGFRNRMRRVREYLKNGNLS